MTKQVRDWQKDMVIQFFLLDKEIINEGGEKATVSVEGLGDLFKQIAAEKERADKAEAESEKWRIEAFRKYPTPDAYDAACAALHKHRERAEQLFTTVEQQGKEINQLQDVNRHALEREKKLREALECVMEHSRNDGISVHLDRCYIEARDVLASLYTEKERKV